jgi:formylglycine-generating enzyme required for sulfatase activity
MWDVGIWHVRDDEWGIVIPLAEALRRGGLDVEYKSFALSSYEQFQQVIERGLKRAKCGLLLVSPHFLASPWPDDGLDYVRTRKHGEETTILHIWHNVTREEVARIAPILAEELAILTSEGLDQVAQLVQSVFTEQDQSKHEFSFETVILDAWGQEVQREQFIRPQHIEDLGHGIVLEMVPIPGGTFLMGASEAEEKQRRQELPRRTVTVASFCIGKFPVTQEQWEVVMGVNPATFKGPKRPVEAISWHDAETFCQRLTERSSRPYRLPSEVEWEYACRAGTSTPFYFGDTITSDVANYNGTTRYASEPLGIFRGETTDVGLFPPNSFGLYDMHGNVREWCADFWHETYQFASTKTAKPWMEGGNPSLRVLRGGAWDFNCFSCRSAARGWRFPVFGAANIGLRVVYSVE